MIVPIICVGICKIHPEHKICMGCYRSRLEIAKWHNATDEEKLKIFEACNLKKELYGDITSA